MASHARVSVVPLFVLLALIARTPAPQAQLYAFPFLGEDLKPGERISTGNHAAGIQGEGEDIGAKRYLGDGKWSDLVTGSGKSNTDFVIYGKPVHAVADGTVVGCWRNAPENPNPPAKHDQFETGTRMVNGKPVPVGRIPGGGNMLFVDHADGRRALYAHMIPGSVPADLCPNNDTLFPKALTIPEGDAFLMLPASAQVPIRRGQLIGKVGNSGSSSAPHLHIHAEQSGKAAIMRFQNGLSKPFSDKFTDIRGGWNDFSGEEVPDGNVLIRPARATPYRMADFEAYEANGRMNYVGIFRPGSYGPMALFESDWNKFLAGWKAIEGRGYRVKDFESYRQGSRQIYAGIFAPGTHGPMALFEASWPAFLKGWQGIEKQGYRMKDFEVFGTGGARRFAGIFEPDNHGPMALFKNNWNEFLADWRTIESKGYRMKDLEIYPDGSGKTYAGIFEPGTYGPMALFRNSWNEFVAGWRDIEKKGYRLIDLEVHREGNGMAFAGIFEPGTFNPAAIFTSAAWNDFLEMWQQLE